MTQPNQPITDDDLWQIPAEHRDLIARWLLQRSAAMRPSWIYPEHIVTAVRDGITGAAVDLADPGADDSSLDHAARVLERLNPPPAGKFSRRMEYVDSEGRKL